MTIFEGIELSARQQLEKAHENFAVSFEIGRKLKEDRPEAMRVGQRTQRFKEPLDLFLRWFQPPDMRQALVCLGSKAKLGGSGGNLSVKRARPRIGAKRVIHFNGIELSSVMLE